MGPEMVNRPFVAQTTLEEIYIGKRHNWIVHHVLPFKKGNLLNAHVHTEVN